jgi:hypothetical protein
MKNDEKNIADMDQKFEFFLRTFPHILYNYYKKLIGEGFSKHQSFILIQDYQNIILNSISVPDFPDNNDLNMDR